MEWTLFDDGTVGYVGLAVGIVSCLLAVLYERRRRKYPGSITYAFGGALNIVTQVSNQFTKLDVIYDGEPIDKRVVLLTGYIINDGVIDITNDMVDEPLVGILPSDCKFLEFEITAVKSGMKVDSKILEDKEVRVDFGLFKKNEAFEFKALILLSDEYYFNTRNRIKFIDWKHRIANTKKVARPLVIADRREIDVHPFRFVIFILMICTLVGLYVREFYFGSLRGEYFYFELGGITSLLGIASWLFYRRSAMNSKLVNLLNKDDP